MEEPDEDLAENAKQLKEIKDKLKEFDKIKNFYQEKIHSDQKINALLSIILFFLIFFAVFTCFEFVYPGLLKLCKSTLGTFYPKWLFTIP